MNQKLVLILGLVGAAGAVFYFWNSTRGNGSAVVAAKQPIPVAQDHTAKYLDLASQILGDVFG